MNEPALRSRAPVFQPRFTPSSPLEQRLHGSLWSWRARSWSGYVDFREPGLYFTHWGWGEYERPGVDDRRLVMRNGYDGFWFELTFNDELTSFVVTRTNHSDRPVGDMLFDYTKQQPPTPFWT